MNAGFMVAVIYMLLKAAGSPLAGEMEKVGGDLLAKLNGKAVKAVKAGPSVEMADQVTTSPVIESRTQGAETYIRRVSHGIG